MPMLRGKHSEESEKQGNKDAAKEANSHIASIARKLDELLKGKEEMDEKLDLLVQSKKEQDTRLSRVLSKIELLSEEVKEMKSGLGMLNEEMEIVKADIPSKVIKGHSQPWKNKIKSKFGMKPGLA